MGNNVFAKQGSDQDLQNPLKPDSSVGLQSKHSEM